MTAAWPDHREPLRATLMRTVGIALVAGTVLSLATHGRVRWPIAVLVMLWPSLGGHVVELYFLRWLRVRLSADRSVQLAARLGTWFVAGMLFATGMVLTARLLGSPMRFLPWWVAGLGFIGVELIAHLALRVRSRPSVYDGQG